MQTNHSVMYEKYIYALQLMDRVIAVKSVPIVEGTTHPCIDKWDELFTYIHTNFIIPKSSDENVNDTDRKYEYNLCGTMLQIREDIGTILCTIPPIFLEVVWPVAIARYLLRECNLPFNHRKSTTFQEFHNRYGNMVLTR